MPESHGFFLVLRHVFASLSILWLGVGLLRCEIVLFFKQIKPNELNILDRIFSH